MSQYTTTNTIGANLYEVGTASTTIDNPVIPKAKVGEIVEGTNGSQWIRLKSDPNVAIPLGGVVQWDNTFLASALTTANSVTGRPVAVAQVAVPVNSYFWAQFRGLAANVLAAASVPAATPLITTTTPGQLINGTTAGTKNVTGITLYAANGASAGTVQGFLTTPQVGASN